ncbi:MAG: kinase/pyrophosphorylase [Methanobrevibacter millerae]|uniref:Kinase/pyrophosphorylase n=1 Tax=Methanobrevibacter millerae TaxID=230361 RepID=A0A8T3VHJ9_9EURY|nr:hypothetical protein [Methanobrevibacter millerae]MBE6505616.1 kinase/pyrophosphorylase [Methanobrevibacter millerae]
MSNKTKVTLTLDTDLVDLAKISYPNFSGRMNELLSIDLHAETEESKLMKEIAKLHDELEIKEDKLCDIRKKRSALEGEASNIKEVLSWARNIYERKGVIGLNMLERECKKQKVSFSKIRDILEQEDVAFVNYA